MQFNDSFSFSNQSQGPQEPRIHGWVDQANYRGTFDIITTCVTTVFICTYSMLVLNLPSPGEHPISAIGRRILWMVIGILGPEFPLTFAAGQWSRAKQSTEAFKVAGYNNWTMRHAFFADMGGFVLQTRNGSSFPVNAKQLLWLITNRKVQYPKYSMEELWDKSKQDRIVKIITAVQVTYFILQCIGRAAQQLAITTLELNTLAIVVCSLMTSYAWLHKGADVFIPLTVPCQYTAEELAAGRSYKLTPLDFIDDHSPGVSVNVLPFMGLPLDLKDQPIQRIPDDRFPTNPHGIQEYLLCLATLLFTGIHLAAWKMSFPSRTEQILWRLSSSIMFGITVAFWVLETIASWHRLGRWKKLRSLLTANGKRRKKHSDQVHQRSTLAESEEDKDDDAPSFPRPWEFWSITFLAVVYGLARLYMITEAFLEFRDMPVSAYKNVEWSEYFPHA